MSYANLIQRQDLISGLRELADFLESNPEVPAPPEITAIVFPPQATNAEKRREIDAIASRIGSGTVTRPACLHYFTSRSFGTVEYRAVAIPAGPAEEA
ncbi:MAG TPA: hypothetical protein VN969_22870 [Streptosporangiaceae bacterium]|nr:hypothetical protein [Streptosporangiaceae bacterium]